MCPSRFGLIWRHGHEAHHVSRLEKRRWSSIGIEQANRTPADDLPSSWGFTRSYSRLPSGDPHRACGNSHTRGLAPGRGDLIVNQSEIRESWEKSQHEYAVLDAGMALDDSIRAQPGPFSD